MYHYAEQNRSGLTPVKPDAKRLSWWTVDRFLMAVVLGIFLLSMLLSLR